MRSGSNPHKLPPKSCSRPQEPALGCLSLQVLLIEPQGHFNNSWQQIYNVAFAKSPRFGGGFLLIFTVAVVKHWRICGCPTIGGACVNQELWWSTILFQSFRFVDTTAVLALKNSKCEVLSRGLVMPQLLQKGLLTSQELSWNSI